MLRPEQALHRATADLLTRLFDNRSDVFWCHVPNGGARSKVEAAILKTMGVKAGVPDLLLIWKGQTYWIELKAPPRILLDGSKSKARPRVSEDQESIMSKLSLAGCETAVCQSLDEVLSVLDRWGIRHR